jgi:hypothetical protein
MRKIVLIALALALSACAVNPGVQRRAFLASLIGQPEAAAVHALGVPARTYQTGGIKFLAYDERRAAVIPGGPFFGGYGYFGAGLGSYYNAFPPEVIERNCETTLEVAGGIVQSWSLRGTLCG